MHLYVCECMHVRMLITPDRDRTWTFGPFCTLALWHRLGTWDQAYPQHRAVLLSAAHQDDWATRHQPAEHVCGRTVQMSTLSAASPRAAPTSWCYLPVPGWSTRPSRSPTGIGTRRLAADNMAGIHSWPLRVLLTLWWKSWLRPSKWVRPAY